MADLFYCSEECARAELPVKCAIQRVLVLEGMANKAAVIEAEWPIFKGKFTSFVVLAKGTSSINDVELDGSLIGVYLLPLDDRVVGDALNLPNGLQPVLDWGAITRSRDIAERWQVR